jgi:hypothetical protein
VPLLAQVEGSSALGEDAKRELIFVCDHTNILFVLHGGTVDQIVTPRILEFSLPSHGIWGRQTYLTDLRMHGCVGPQSCSGDVVTLCTSGAAGRRGTGVFGGSYIPRATPRHVSAPRAIVAHGSEPSAR